jgi:hypothetical protein
MATSSRDTAPQEPSAFRGSRRRRVFLAYVVFGIVTAAAGYGLLPARNTLYAAPGLGVTVYQGDTYGNTESNNAVRLRVTPQSSGGAEVHLLVTSSAAATQTPSPRLRTRIVFPRGTTLRGCPADAITPPYESDIPQCTRDVSLRYSIPEERWEAAQIYTVAKPTSLVLATGNGAVEGALPQVYGTKQLDSIHVTVQLEKVRRYNWTGGPPPTDVQDDQVRWNLDVGQARAGMQPVTAVDRAAQYNDSLRTLGAGIVFGLAGSAWFAAVQEFFPRSS